MKKQLWTSMIVLPFLLVGCNPKETTKEKMDAGAEKVSEGVKNMADAADDQTAKAKAAVDTEVKAAADAAKDAADKAKDAVKGAIEE
jgi:hypothetical protein